MFPSVDEIGCVFEMSMFGFTVTDNKPIYSTTFVDRHFALVRST